MALSKKFIDLTALTKYTAKLKEKMYLKTEVNNLFNSYYTKSQVDSMIDNIGMDDVAYWHTTNGSSYVYNGVEPAPSVQPIGTFFVPQYKNVAESGVTDYKILSPITSLGAYCFNKCTTLSDVIIPNTVTSIGEYCFLACENLSSLILPNNISSIASNAFGIDEASACSALITITYNGTSYVSKTELVSALQAGSYPSASVELFQYTGMAE